MPTKAELQTTLDETKAELAKMVEMAMQLRRYVLSNTFKCSDTLESGPSPSERDLTGWIYKGV